MQKANRTQLPKLPNVVALKKGYILKKIFYFFTLWLQAFKFLAEVRKDTIMSKSNKYKIPSLSS